MVLNLTQNTSYNPLDLCFVYTYDKFISKIDDIQIYIDYIIKLISDSDYAFFQYDTEYARNVESKCNGKLINTININGHLFMENKYLIDLTKNKKTFIELFKTNLSDPDEREPYDYNIKNKHITYDELLDNTIILVKNNIETYLISLSDGFIYDFNNFIILNEYKKELNLK